MISMAELEGTYNALLTEENRERIETTIALSGRSSTTISYYGPFQLYRTMIQYTYHE